MYNHTKAEQPARTYIQQLCEDTRCSPEDLPEAMNDREKWRERVRDICASGTTRWWWWDDDKLYIYIYIYIYIYMCVCVCVCVCVCKQALSNCEGNGRNVPGHSKRARTCLACRAEKRNRYGGLEHIWWWEISNQREVICTYANSGEI